MGKRPDYRDLIVDCKACRRALQEEHMDGTLYYDFEPWLRSIRPGSVGRVFRPFLLGGVKGSTYRQRQVWAERADKVKAKGAKLASIEPPLTGHKLAMYASEEIGRVARGRGMRNKTGHPPKVYTEAQMAIIRNHWPRRHGVKVREAVERINKAIAPRKVTAGWLYANVK